MKLKKADRERLAANIMIAAMSTEPDVVVDTVIKACRMLGMDNKAIEALNLSTQQTLYLWTTRVEAMEFDCPTCKAPATTYCQHEVVMVQPRRASHAARHTLALEHGATRQPFNSKAVIL